jgi:hypothetical protein
LTDFRGKKNPQISNFIKIRPVGAELFHADGHTNRRKNRQADMKKLTVGFRNFANALKNRKKKPLQGSDTEGPQSRKTGTLSRIKENNQV